MSLDTPVNCLRIVRGIPIWIVDNHPVSTRNCQTKSAYSRRRAKCEKVRIFIIEIIYIVLPDCMVHFPVNVTIICILNYILQFD